MTQSTRSLDWLDGSTIRPYVFVRPENRMANPGTRFDSDWFEMEPLYFDPLGLDQAPFGLEILKLENQAFQGSGLPMPGWVFFDCAVMPGFIAGFAHRADMLPAAVAKALRPDPQLEWVPLSLFIIIPAQNRTEWIAHNLTSVNSLLEPADRFYALGFLTKAFGLWHTNIDVCCGMTQWGAPALKLHAHYGPLQILTAYTPLHSHPHTLTYRLRVDPHYWALFFNRGRADRFSEQYESAGFQVDPQDRDSQIAFQRRIEGGEGPYFLDPEEIRRSSDTTPLKVYAPKQKVATP